jgi:hypothetical protein
MKPQEFIGKKATYDKQGQMIFGEDAKEGMQLLLDVRGWGAIQHLFKTQEEAMKFQDEIGEWFVDAINEKLAKC